SRVTLTQIERGERKVTADELATFCDALSIEADILLGRAAEPEVAVSKPGKVKEGRLSYGKGIRINVPEKNLEKFREVLLYILNKVGSKPNIGESVIYKLLYFIDFDFYERYEEQLIGATYIKNRYGPTPVEFRKIVEGMLGKDIIKVEDKYFQYPQTKYLPTREADLKKLCAHEVEVIDRVLEKLSGMNAAQVSEYSHNDVPWLTGEEGKAIEYESVFYRTPAYSVRQYGPEAV
ncbi:MAG: Panacea domain-containing protein, partial [Chloroflexi bacterium]|nr:Panacea domain-containing protein [Chloroflexota bacterium]